MTPEQVGEIVERKRQKRNLRVSEVETIRARAATGKVTLAQLAREYNVGVACIRSIVTRRTWRHIIP